MSKKKKTEIGDLVSNQVNRKVNFKRLLDTAVLPQYQTPGASGMDLHAAQEFILNKGQIRLVSTGWALELPPGMEGQIRPRSSMALKGVTVINSPGTIDADYRGEVKVALINLSSDSVSIKVGDRIAQLVVCPILKAEIDIVSELSDTQRGNGGFGSTGK